MSDHSLTESFLTPEQENAIVQAISLAEQKTSGEIRVHIDASSKEDQFAHAQQIFLKLHMDQTQDRNAILFHISTKNRCFVVIGDLGIHQKVSPSFWENLRNEMSPFFSKGHYAEGIIYGINHAGLSLATFFPYEKTDSNELPNEISRS